MDIRVLSDADFEQWYAVYSAAYSRPFDAPWLEVEKRVNLTDDEYTSTVALAGWQAGRIVVGGAVVLPLRDNLELAYVDLFTHPEARRQGHGSAMLAAIADVARQHGRTRLFLEAMWSVADTTDAGHEFLGSHGSSVDLLDAVRVLDLPASVGESPVAEGYTLHAWRGACPEEWVAEYADLRHRMNAEAPSGEVGLESEHWDAARVRLDEANAARSRRITQVTIARSDQGSLVGHTQLSIPEDSTEVYQWDTLVLKEHRGYGLGMSLKAENMRAAADLLVGRSRIVTYNAASNDHMIAVNEELGYRLVAWSAEHLLDL